ncbi:MAG: SMP-30/gluconolactonase/LRE family protein [Caldilineaceae bacterium]|nr:SMP-30/gluconolactonase/LRE family protein [Caldilineaceae bacterium]
MAYNLSRPFARVTGWDPVVAADLAPPRREEERALQATAPEHLRSNRLIFVLFGIWWTAASWIAYTVAGEKMPWLLVHIALPMCVFGGWWLGYTLRRIDWQAAWEKRTWLVTFAAPALMILALIMLVALSNPGSDPAAGRVLQWLLILGSLGAVVFYSTFWVVQAGFQEGMRLLAVGLAGLLLVLAVRTTFTLNYINYDMATEYLVYAHGGPDIKRALDEIDTISQRTVGERNIVVAYDDDSAWPFSWYMRLYPNAKFYGNNPTPDAMSAPVVIVGPENRPKVEPYMARDYIKRTYRRMWWPEMDYFDLTWDRLWGAIADPAQRQRVFDIIAFRKYRNPDNLATFRDLAHWPYQGEFDMYVRRDLAAQIWDLAVLPVSQETPDIPVLGPEQLRIVTAGQIYTGDYGGLPLVSPRAVAIGPAGERVIADSGNHRIVILDRDGNYLRSFGSFCNVNDPQNTPCTDPDGAAGPAVVGDGQFYEPWGVVVDPQGSLYVADTWNGRIQVFDLEGNLLRKWGIFATTNAELGDPNALFGPRGLAIDLDGNLLVADTGNKRILKFTPGGELIEQIGGGGVIAGRFEEPTDVTVDPTDGSYLVADSWNGRVQRFSTEMDYLGEFLVPGWSGREVSQKPFLTVLADGAIYATDPATALIIVFNRDGTVRGAFGGSGVDANRIGLANGITADLSAAAVVVADAGNNRVMVFPEVKE